MRERDLRQLNRQRDNRLDEPEEAPGADLARIRSEATADLDAADAAIERALSGNSEAFIAASRQMGGQ